MKAWKFMNEIKAGKKGQLASWNPVFWVTCKLTEFRNNLKKKRSDFAGNQVSPFLCIFLFQQIKNH